MSARRRRWRRGLILLLALALVVGLAAWALSGLGQWLIVADPLEPAQAIVVLGGGIPFRAMEAASLYQRGWAPQVWVTRAVDPAEETALARLGVEVVGEETYNRQVLERLGVPLEAIRILEGAQNTVEEVQLIARELRRIGGERVILVTSRPHSRRVRVIWYILVRGAPQVIVRFATEDPYHPSHWWRQARDARAVSREVFGLLNAWAGFPVRQESR
jgi:uncharacterized SAM-binding protein YcdF (DUF218 family)